MKFRLSELATVTWTTLLALAATWLLLWPATAAADGTLTQQARALQRAQQAMVGVQVVAVDEARSARTLGRNRQGSGVLISADGLVLTIGYLVLEAEQVELLRDDGRPVPARVVGYDVATGFGLVQALAPLGLEPVPLGRADQLAPQAALMVASGGDEGAVSVAELVARRPFSGYWEYHIDGALFTARPGVTTAAPACSTRRASWWASAPWWWPTRRADQVAVCPVRAAAATCSCRSTYWHRSWPTCGSRASAPPAGGPGWA